MQDLLFRGAATALVTPFEKNNPDRIDESAFRNLVRRQCDAGIRALVTAGTTGEASALTDTEHIRLCEIAREEAGAGMPIIAGCGAPTTARAVSLVREAAQAGADAVLVVTPYYNKCSQEGLYRHYTAIADASPLPVILYEVPSRTGLHVTPETYARLAVHDNIVALKDAAGDLERVPLIRSMTGDRLAVYSGSDGVTVPMLSVGAVGVISVLSNLCPYAVSEMCEAWFSGNTARAAELQCRYASLNRALFSEVNPIPVKCAMAQLGMCAEVFRLPLCPMNAEDSRRIAQMAEAFL
ncbi:MAG: 4-hydroxy-tetrahydrodipicolinate synthase [Clostridia bacterium]|nr:4-hydroxy-tetrahydrodipicolinate synthase [Clostridia bacterium]